MELNLTTKCRGCLAEEPEMHNLFHLLTEELSLANVVSQTTSTQIEECKEISPYLCIKCTQIVVDFYNFKVQFAQSQMYFQNGLDRISKNDSLTRFIILKEQDTVLDNIHVIEDNEICENIKVNKDLLDEQKSEETLQTDHKIDLEENLLTLNTTISNNNKAQNMTTKINMQLTPEVGEFTVQNELVQLIESVVFCCKSCRTEYLLKDDFLSHMNSEHGKTKMDTSKFTKKTLVKLPLGKVIEENVDVDFGLEKDKIPNEHKLCKICKKFISKVEYDGHREEHKKHICSCGAKFLKASDLVNHKMSKHSDERNFVCEYCDKAFKVKQLLTKHMRLHTHPRQEICHICGQIFNDKSVLQTHIKLKHFPTRDYQCCQCGLKFPLKSTLNKHLRRHNTNRKKTVSCSICNMTYFEKSTLNRHMAIKHTDQPIKSKCEYCGKTFTTKSNLYKHLRISHKHDRFVIDSDGSIAVQKGGNLTRSPHVNKVVNFLLDHGVLK